ncbi:hypothetical protein Btru_033150, partial [Bulinus truncatus]
EKILPLNLISNLQPNRDISVLPLLHPNLIDGCSEHTGGSKNIRGVRAQKHLKLHSAHQSIEILTRNTTDFRFASVSRGSTDIRENNTKKSKEFGEEEAQNFLKTASLCPNIFRQDDELIFELQAKLSQLEREKICLKEKVVETALEHQRMLMNLMHYVKNLKIKRKKLKTKIVKLESPFEKKWKNNSPKSKKKNKRLKQQILLLRQTSSSGYTEESVKSLLGEIAESKRQIIQLSESLHKKEVLVVHETKEFNLPSLDSVDDSDKLYIKYLQDIIQDKVKLLNAKVHEVQQSYLQLKRTEFHLAEAKKENVILVHERDKLKSLNAHLNISLQELQRKYEPKQFQPSLTEKVKIVDDEPEPLTLSNQNRNNISQAICLTEKCGDSRDVTRGAATGNDKENLSAIDCDNSQRSVKGKSLLLTMKSTSHSSDNKTVEHMTLDHSNKKPEMKYKNVTYQKVDEPSECKQQ